MARAETGNKHLHWKDDRLTGQCVGIMDPTLADGQRDVITENDLAALRSLGYTVGQSASEKIGLSLDDHLPSIENA